MVCPSIIQHSEKRLEAGRLTHMDMLTTYDSNKVTLSPKHFVAEAYKFSRRCLFPLLCPIVYVALYMLQSGAYLPSPDWLKKFNKMDLTQTQVGYTSTFFSHHC